jgi:hypothetical protein
MERLNVFIDKEKIDKLFNEEKYKNCMEKKYFEYVVSNGKIDYIDKYLKDSKNRKIIERECKKNILYSKRFRKIRRTKKIIIKNRDF